MNNDNPDRNKAGKDGTNNKTEPNEKAGANEKASPNDDTMLRSYVNTGKKLDGVPQQKYKDNNLKHSPCKLQEESEKESLERNITRAKDTEINPDMNNKSSSERDDMKEYNEQDTGDATSRIDNEQERGNAATDATKKDANTVNNENILTNNKKHDNDKANTEESDTRITNLLSIH